MLANGGGLSLREYTKTTGIEDIGFDFAFVAFRGDFLAV